MEIKIFCDCGAKYKFETEPVDGLLPGPVYCPVCGAEGTARGNAIIQASSAAAPTASPAPVQPAASPAIVIPAAAPSQGFVAPVIPRSSKAVAVQVAATPPPPPPTPNPIPVPIPIPVSSAVTPGSAANKLSVAAVQAHASANPPPPPPPMANAPMPPPVSQRQSDGAIPASGPSVSRGFIGVALAGFISLLAWFAITSVFFSRLKWLAILIGLFIGWTGRKMGKISSPRIALAASIATVVVMLLGSLWAGHREAEHLTDQTLKELYDAELAFAKEAVQVKSDEEIAALIKKSDEADSSTDGDLRQVSARSTDIDPKRIADWKRTELPELRKLASGQVSRYQYEREHRPLIQTVFGVATLFSHTFKISMLFWMVLGATTSYKMATR